MVCIDVSGLVKGAVVTARFLLVAGYSESLTGFRWPLIKSLIGRGLSVHTAAPNMPANDPVRLELERHGITVHNIPLIRTGTNPIRDLRTLWSLWRVMIHIRPHYVLSYTIKPVVYGSIAGALASVPNRFALITGLGYAFTGKATGLRAVVKAAAILLYWLALNRNKSLFFQNPDDEGLFRQIGIVHPATRSVVVNGSGIDLSRFKVVNLPLGAAKFLLIARLIGDKGVREYAIAAQRIKLLHPQVQFLLVGWIDENPDAITKGELEKWIEDRTINYLGRLQDVRPAIAQCSVFVLPSYREGTPRSTLEAMSMGRAIITTDVPGCRETVVDGDNGFLVPVQSSDALFIAMKRFIDDPGLLSKMGQRSRQIAEAKYDVHKVNNAMLLEMGL
jgi:glycosyltransferase involved in cell wall biosynthesis